MSIEARVTALEAEVALLQERTPLLRDWFALSALTTSTIPSCDHQEMVKHSYLVADLMLIEREV